MIRATAVLLAVFAAAALSGCGGEDGGGQTGGGGGRVLRFSAIPNQDTTMLKAKFDPLADYLEEKVGVPVEYVPSTNYEGSVEMFVNGDIHLAWFGGLTGVQAREKAPGAKAIVQGDTDPTFRSYFIAHQDVSIEPSEEFPMGIADLTFTFGAQSSTSGRLMPEYFIRQATGKAPNDFFATPPAFQANHDQTAELVESGAMQAGVLDYSVYERRVKNGQTNPEVCRVIWKTPEFADYNFTVRPDVDELFGSGTTEKLTQALLDLTDERILSAFPRTRLIPAANEDYARIRSVAIEIGMLR